MAGDGVLKPLYTHPKAFLSVRSQYRYYAGRFRGAAIFFQVGGFYEFYGKRGNSMRNHDTGSPINDGGVDGKEERDTVHTMNLENPLGKEVLSNLRRLKVNRRGAACGFPVRLEQTYATMLLKSGRPVVIIKETDRYLGRIKERLPIVKMIKTKEEKVC